MKARTNKILDMCIEKGIRVGYKRLTDNNETYDADTIEDYIYNAIWDELNTMFRFSEEAE